jgi:hypothetical protein
VKLPTVYRRIAARTPEPPTAEDGRVVSAAVSRHGLAVRSSRGQVLVIFSGIFVVLLLISALVIDLAWLWNNSLRIQRTADAAALAGVVNLPTNFSGNNGGPASCKNALTCALTEAGRNGYLSGSGGVTVTPTQDGTNPRRLNVKVTAPVQTFFLGLIGMNQVIISRTAHAEYVLPVPMGSPENYYGVFGKVRDATMTTTSTSSVTGASQTAGPQNATTAPAGTPWTTPSGTLPNAITTNDTTYALTNTNLATQQWSGFGFLSGGTPPITAPVGGNPSTAINIIGLQLAIEDSFISAACANSTIGIALSWDGGTAWSTQVNTPVLGISTTTGDYTLGNNNNTTPWGAHAWVRNDFSDPNFRVRVTANKGCGVAGTTLNIDRLQPSAFFTITTATTTTTRPPAADYDLHGPGAPCPNLVANCFLGTPGGGGQILNPRGFWGTMNTEGAFNSNGDAYQPYYDDNGTNGSTTQAFSCPATAKACYGPDDFYNYAIEMQPNTSGGYVYIFDPVFCETAIGSGTGDRHFNGDVDAVSSFYELYSDDLNTPFIRSDDTLRASSGNTFQSMAFQDSTMGGANGSECKQANVKYNDERDFHDAWYLLNPTYPLTGGPDGTTYRVHTTGTDPSNVAQQRGADGEQSFAIYATDSQAPATYPRVYGLGAMQAFTPLEAVLSPSEFYLAQIDPVHLGKTLEIRLWDPGDTNQLSAWLEILIPDNTAPGGYRTASVTYSAAVGTTNSAANSACNTNKRTSASAALIQTSNGGTKGFFNGCWLTIDTVIPAWYTGNSTLPGDFGWWKIRYTMTGVGVSSDVTTWTADIRGNPVHLVEP